MSAVRLLPALYLVSAGLTAVVAGPLLGALIGVGPRYLLYRDAVSTPRSYVTDAALGVGDLPPRAVPQDWFVAMGSRVVDGGWLVAAIIVVALVVAGVGYGRLAHRLVPGAGHAGAVATAMLAIWNPYVAERLLQGHWGLLVGYAALGWIVVEMLDLTASPVRWCRLAGLVAVAGLTPTGSLLAAAVLVTMCLSLRVRPRIACGVAGVWIASAAPWLAAGLIGTGSSTGVGGVEAFGLRAEPFLGRLGTAAGLGGIWNADAVPDSRTIGWAAVASLCLLVVVVSGLIHLRAGDRSRTSTALTLLAGVVLMLVILSAFGPGQAVLGWAVDAIPGAGLLRDTQKFLALLMPAYAVGAAGAVLGLRRWVPGGFALAGVALLVVAPLPDLAWGVGGQLRPVAYPAEWTTVAGIVTADDGAVALWPSDTVRHYGFANGVSLDPAPRMMRAPVVESGRLTVDGQEVDPASPPAVAVEQLLGSPGDPGELARLGIGWVLVEADPPPARLRGLEPVFAGESLRLFRIEGAQTVRADVGYRVVALAAHLVWLVMIVGGAVAAVYLRRRHA